MGRRKAILHVNILRRFYEHASDTDNPTSINMIVAETDDGAGDGIEELPNPHDGGGPSDVMIGDEMTTEQRQSEQSRCKFRSRIVGFCSWQHGIFWH